MLAGSSRGRQVRIRTEHRVVPSDSKEPRAVGNARVYLIQIKTTQAGKTNYHGVLVIPRASCEGADTTSLTEEVIGIGPSHSGTI